jgi:hypothetical protein
MIGKKNIENLKRKFIKWKEMISGGSKDIQ